jgi:hypothetical protein
MAQVTEARPASPTATEAKPTSPAEAFYRAVREHNDRARLLAREGRCGGCIGAGKARNCVICGGLR